MKGESWNERKEVTNERREMKWKEESNEWKERDATKEFKYQTDCKRRHKRKEVTNGIFKGAKRKDGRNEMKDLRRREAVTNGRKELKGKEESNLLGERWNQRKEVANEIDELQ